VSEPVRTATGPIAAKSKLDGALLRFRIMAFVTGVVLICGTVALIFKDVVGLDHMEPGTGLLWVLHGYLYLIYVITVLNLGIKARWHLVRMALVALAGTIPTMSFVAEHVITRYVREHAQPPSGTATA
jgi:integral membrane protein